MARDFSKMSDEEIKSIYQANFGQGKQPQTTQTPQQPDVSALLKQASPSFGQSIANSMSVLGGGKPLYDQSAKENPYLQQYSKNLADKQFESPLTDQYKQAQIDALKQKGQGGGFFYVDSEGNAHAVQGAMPGAKPLPAGTTPIGQEALQNRSDYSAAGVPLRKAQTHQFETGNKILDSIEQNQQNGQGITPGTTFTGGGVTVPLNPVLNDQQMAAVSGSQSLEPIVKRITDSLNGGIYNSDMGDVGRTLRQFSSNTKIPLLTSQDPKLQALQSDLNTLKKTIPFTEGGKQLTPFEAKQVFALLDTTGKNNNQIINDLNQSMQILRSKESLTLGGRNAAMQPNSEPLNQSNKQLDAQTAQQFLEQAGGDKDKARELAKSQGYIF